LPGCFLYTELDISCLNSKSAKAKSEKKQMHIKKIKNILNLQQVPTIQRRNIFSHPPGSKLRSSLAAPVLLKYDILHKSTVKACGINPYLLLDNPRYNLKRDVNQNKDKHV